uniref:HSF-type DNA-binding domain-containing protein n=1 Tax=Grammatophora oceanica TaxID=210454 RepID=A0A6U5FFV3_9STRA|mmetsp:Transcript_10228/g.14929  ORF Transcript_10228/g.14929 Transcript_10228/m.14929 type:complete len:344 (+) Transcript_10228:157-1188(+)|eukprot:CAMPEP_0194032158 /NCGR_PEP_ID=MMETSP0009_2-20130614/5160_1 /TAXON_ID=210454 /ORGANISM="Grammatophora oceanica, Strain CCMP 410" /LENGTH=343 /DNA_ID=CAMNT_0038672515 /DNA_START=72 /DNA_END=1103 /DNA_ORIENTATION=-
MMLQDPTNHRSSQSNNQRHGDTPTELRGVDSSPGHRSGEVVGLRDSPVMDPDDLSGTNKTFPETLRAILSDPNLEAIQWLDHGKAFIIRDRSEFIERILPQYLGKATKYTSFTRKLSRWKFQRTQCGPEEGAWYNEKFTRDSDGELKDMKCAKRKKASSSIGSKLRSPSKKKTVVKATVRKQHHTLPSKKLSKRRSMPLKKRPVDASLFELMAAPKKEPASSCRMMGIAGAPPSLTSSPPPFTPYGTDTTTQSIVNAAVKVLASANTSPTTLSPNHAHHGGSGLFHRTTPSSSAGVPSSLDLLAALRGTQNISNHTSTIPHHHHPVPRLSIQQLLARATSVTR